MHTVSAEAGLVEEEGSFGGRTALEGHGCRLGGAGDRGGGGEGEFADSATEGEKVSELLGGGGGRDVGDVDGGGFRHGLRFCMSVVKCCV